MSNQRQTNPQSIDDLSFDVTRAPRPNVPPLRWVVSKSRRQRSYWRWYFITDPILGVFKYSLTYALRFAPAAWPSAVGAGIARFSQKYYTNQEFSQRVCTNMAQLSQGSPKLETDRAVAEWWQNTGRIFAEFSSVEKLAVQQAKSIALKTTIANILKSHENVLFVSVHIGAWEVLFATLDLCVKQAIIGPYQPEASRFSNRIIEGSRRRRNQFAFPPGLISAMYISRFIKNRSAIGFFMIDEVSDDQIHFPLFGRAPSQSTNAARAIKIALRNNTVIVPVIMPRKSGTQFYTQFLEPINTANIAPDKDAITNLLQRLNFIFEPYVKENLEQWYMLARLKLDKKTS